MSDDEAPWPRRTTISLYKNVPSVMARGQAIGLHGQALRAFATHTPLMVTIDVYEDGHFDIVLVNGMPVFGAVAQSNPKQGAIV